MTRRLCPGLLKTRHVITMHYVKEAFNKMRVSDTKPLMLVMKHKMPYFFLHLSMFNELACCEIAIWFLSASSARLVFSLFIAVNFVCQGETARHLFCVTALKCFSYQFKSRIDDLPTVDKHFEISFPSFVSFFPPFSRPSCFSFHPIIIIIIIITVCQRKLLLNKTLPFITLTSVHFHALLFTTLPSPRSFFLS